MELNFDFLAKETIDLTESLDSSFIRKFDGFDHSEEEQYNSKEDIEESKGPGLAFKIEEGMQTYCIRAVVTDHLEYLPSDLEQGDRRLYQGLRIEEMSELRDIYTFETGSIELAEVIIDQVCNRRFAYQEDNLFNISDPGFSWWLDDKPNKIQIYFQSHGIDRSERYQNIGPLGDGAITASRLMKFLPVLEKHLSVSEFVSSPKSFTFSVHQSKEGDLFDRFKRLLIHGECITDFIEFGTTSEQRTLKLFLDELTVLRQFWLSVEDYLSRSA